MLAIRWVDRWSGAFLCNAKCVRRLLISRLFAEEKSKLAAAGHRRPPDMNADEGVSRLNLEYYRKRLETETDLVIRQILLRLIADEKVSMAPPDVQKACGED